MTLRVDHYRTNGADWTVTDSEGTEFHFSADWDATFTSDAGAIYEPSGVTGFYYEGQGGFDGLRGRWSIILNKKN
jgi:hypothetical protein